MRENVCSVRFVPLDNVAILLSEFTKVAEHEMPIEPRHGDFLSLDPQQEAIIRKHAFFVLAAAKKRLNDCDYLGVEGYIVTHADFVLE